MSVLASTALAIAPGYAAAQDQDGMELSLLNTEPTGGSSPTSVTQTITPAK
jgi:hypothetical protein